VSLASHPKCRATLRVEQLPSHDATEALHLQAIWLLAQGRTVPLANRHFASLAELDATIAKRCRRLDTAAVRPHTDFHW
jgi:hypothetical protein